MSDPAATIRAVCDALRLKDLESARGILRSDYPFTPADSEGRRYTEYQSLRVFLHDGFIDRYSGAFLVFPGVLRLLSRLLPQEFPFHPNWKVSKTHPAYWELFPTIDHLMPVARGGRDEEVNWVTTSMLRNSAKGSWTLEELGWQLLPIGSLANWDGLTRFFLEYVGQDRTVLEEPYLQRWHSAAIRAVNGLQ